MPSLPRIILLSCFLTRAMAVDNHRNGILLPRQTSSASEDGLIDPVTQPYCEYSSCWHWGSPPPELCELVDGPCANDTDASDNMAEKHPDGRGPKCGMKQYRRECYCNLKAGLSCAWWCNWKLWWETEDWFAKVCPESPATKPVDFSGLPSCARHCLDDALFQYGCLTQTSNCFCSRGDIFDCHKKCGDEEEWQQIANWLQQVCPITPSEAKQALKSGRFSLETVTGPEEPTVTETKLPRLD
ncbi:hypothetical protein DL765_007464 [Monosporascus sp. GIB2]|nr:hypothetical protein DL765_007464 [Monosporascus sp. GIB2]